MFSSNLKQAESYALKACLLALNGHENYRKNLYFLAEFYEARPRTTESTYRYDVLNPLAIRKDASEECYVRLHGEYESLSTLREEYESEKA